MSNLYDINQALAQQTQAVVDALAATGVQLEVESPDTPEDVTGVCLQPGDVLVGEWGGRSEVQRVIHRIDIVTEHGTITAAPDDHFQVVRDD